jgi:prefoldin subunit 5
MPEVVFESQEEDGTTTSSIAYGKAGFSIAASLIAPVSRHEDRIKELEKNIEKMQKELKQIRTA